MTQGEHPLGNFIDLEQQVVIEFFKLGVQLKEIVKDVSDGKEAVGNIVESFGKLIAKQRGLLNLAGEAEDEGTVALMSDYISQQEKTVWMYRSYLGH